MPTWNGIHFFDLPEWAPLSDFELSSDASGNQGFGVYNNGAWFYQAWLPVQQPLGMAYKELFPIVLACHVWGPSWSNMRIKFWCDNQSVVHIIQSGTSKGVSPSRPRSSACPSANTQEFVSPFDMQSLRAYTNSLMFHGLAKSTRKTYSASQRRFLEFCYWSKLIHDSGSPLPASEQTLMLFAAHLSRLLKPVPSKSTYRAYGPCTSNMALIIP